MVQPDRPAANGFVAAMRKVYNPLGFQRGYNFTLFFIFGGAMLGFCLARFQYLNFNGVFCNPNNIGGNTAAPGECYYYTSFLKNRVGIIMHLLIVPASFLAVFQFVPVIRHKALLYHRMAGYIIIILTVFANAATILIAPNSFGGAYTTQLLVGMSVIWTTFGLFNAIYNIKRQQIDQHRAWMIRVWVYMGSIITTRIIMIITATLTSTLARKNYESWPCAKLAWTIDNSTRLALDYPTCVDANGGIIDTSAAVLSDFNGEIEQIGSSLAAGFNMALILAFALHVLGAELYLLCTPKEKERLRQVSYQRQLERGMKNPGSAGLVIEKIADAEPWAPKNQRPALDKHISDSSSGNSREEVAQQASK